MSSPPNSSSEVSTEHIERRLDSYTLQFTPPLPREDRSLSSPVTADAAPSPFGMPIMADRSHSLLDSAEAGQASIAFPIDSPSGTTLHNEAQAPASDEDSEDTDDEDGLLWWSPRPDAIDLERDVSPASRRQCWAQDHDSEGDITSLSAPFRHLTGNDYNGDNSAILLASRPFPPESVPGHDATPQNAAGFPSQIFCDPRASAHDPSVNVSLSVRLHPSSSAVETTSVETIADSDLTDMLQVEWHTASDDASSTFQPQADISIFQQSSFLSKDSWLTYHNPPVPSITEEFGDASDQGASDFSSSAATFHSQFSESRPQSHKFDFSV
jgi:hypothetical protein